LKDGVVLCRLLNTIKEGSCAAPSTSKMPFKQMENISRYLEGCSKLGVPSYDSFQTVALYENKDWMAVLNNIHSLGRVAQKVEGFSGPTLGAKLAGANKRNFTEDQLRQSAAAPTFIGKGSHGGATQSGMFDGSKNIVRTDLPAGCSDAMTRMTMGSSGLASQAGSVDAGRNIVRGATPAGKENAAAKAAPVAAACAPSDASNAVARCLDMGSGGGATRATYVKYEEREAEDGGSVLYGLDRELAEKAKLKFDPQLETDARAWIEGVLGEKLADGPLQPELKDGVVLCRLLNTIKEGSCAAPSTSKMPFKQMENISRYLEGCSKLGVPSYDSFQTVALYENKDWMAVLNNIHSLGRVAQKVEGFSGPTLGAKLAGANKRNFTEDQLRQSAAAPTFIGKGSHGGATQSGMFDGSKNIVRTDLPAGCSDAMTRMTMGSSGLASQAGSVDKSRNIVRNMG